MKKIFNLLVVCLCIMCCLTGCSKDDEPQGGKGAMYRVTIEQSGEYQSYIKSVVVAAHGTKIINDDTGETYTGTAVLGDEELTGTSVTLATEGKAVEFAVSGGVVDGEDDVVNEPMQWIVTVWKNGKEIERKTLVFQDGKELSSGDLKLYYR